MSRWTAVVLILVFELALLYYGYGRLGPNDGSYARAAEPPAGTRITQSRLLRQSVSGATTRTFGGYPCVGDCSQHEAGYRWARQNGIVDPDNCTGLTSSFIEGCRVYARSRDEQANTPDSHLLPGSGDVP